ncbi:hypothetical protein BS47DRAFT_1389493 [Hydnum rufescens UP504]|uniref:Uncharacterized protein n=1 Tax=Hydnum rufescens UP504 TaxID=1448309 RepID=A0A9P6B4W1_9AGAM|nr:hypothetical protein BS47DRAFT_1389493 [Hydnum rufescens UP504]
MAVSNERIGLQVILTLRWILFTLALRLQVSDPDTKCFPQINRKSTPRAIPNKVMDTTKIMGIAAQQLRHFPGASWSIPNSYVTALTKHASAYPNDLNFIVTLQPGQAYGAVYCLETDCRGTIIKLAKAAGGDGGLKDGFGTFFEYQKHIRTSEGHVRSRLQRMHGASASGVRPSDPVQNPSLSQPKPRPSGDSLLSALDNSLGGRPRAAPSVTRASVPVLSSSVPHKRHSDTFDNLVNARSSLNGPSQPLLPVRTGGQGHAPPASVPSVNADNAAAVENIRLQITAYDNWIRANEPTLRSLQSSKKKFTKLQSQRRDSLEAALASTKHAKAVAMARLATLQSFAPVPRSGAVKLEAANYVKKEYVTDHLDIKPEVKPNTTPHVQHSVVASRHGPSGRDIDIKPEVKSSTTPHVQHSVVASRHGPSGHDIDLKPDVKPNTTPHVQHDVVASRYGPSGHDIDLKPERRASFGDIAGPPQALAPKARASLPGYGVFSVTPDHLDELAESEEDNDALAFRLAKTIRREGGGMDDFILAMAGSTFDHNAKIEDGLKKLELPDINTHLPGMAIKLLPHQVLGVAWMLDREKHTYDYCILPFLLRPLKLFLRRVRANPEIVRSWKNVKSFGPNIYSIAVNHSIIILLSIVSRPIWWIDSIALMTQNLSDDPARKTTLIGPLTFSCYTLDVSKPPLVVAPLALLSQWKAEIESRTDGDLFKVLIYHGSRDKKPRKKSSLQKYDVVLTTFHTLASEVPNYEKMEKEKTRRKTDDFIEFEEDDEQKAKKPGLLMAVPWYRIVLDEAQNIRNRQTHISISVAELDSTYRWCLTGTPITNSLADSYAMFRFLRIRPWNDWTDFREQIYQWERRNPAYASRKLQAIWQVTMLRRKKDSFLDGKPLVQLPSRTVYDDELSFGPEERSIYDFVSHRAQCIFNRFLRAGTVLKNYAHVLIMLLRLRQICVHPCLIEEGQLDVFRTPEEIHSMKDREALNEGQSRVQPFYGIFSNQDNILQSSVSIDATTEDGACPVCFEPLGHEAVVTQCLHSFCDECLDKVLAVPHVDDVNDANKYKANERPCPTCRGPISRAHAYKRAAFEPVQKLQNDTNSDDEDEQPHASSSRKRKVEGNQPSTPAKSKVNSSNGDMDSPAVRQVGKRQSQPRKTKAVKRPIIFSDVEDSDDSMDDFIVYSDEESMTRSRRDRLFKEDDDTEGSQAEETDDDDDSNRFVPSSAPVDKKSVKLPPPNSLASFLPSTKMKAMMDLLKRWREEAPNDKVMVISQWTSVLELCSAYLDENRFRHVIFEGKLSIAQRNERVAKFMGDPRVTVMLMSLKAGGVGLNLTAASRVINLDLAWSNAVENQAFDRVHRLGQQKPVHIHRLIIANTVEARVLQLQSRKQSLADGSLGEGTGERIGRLSIRELANLFGLDPHGRVLPPAPEPIPKK